MRLHEIDDRTAEIQDRLNVFFTIKKGSHIDITDGIVNVDGNVLLRSNRITNASSAKKAEYKARSVNELPVKFGNVSGEFKCHIQALTTLNGSPDRCGSFSCTGNKLRNLIGGPAHVDTDYFCYSNPLQTLDGLPDFIGRLLWIPFRKNMPLLKVFFVKGIQTVYVNAATADMSDARTIQDILNKHLSNGPKGAIIAAAELTRTGFKEMARK